MASWWLLSEPEYWYDMIMFQSLKLAGTVSVDVICGLHRSCDDQNKIWCSYSSPKTSTTVTCPINAMETQTTVTANDDVIKWNHFPRYWSFVRGIYRSPMSSPHKGQWRGAFMFSLICAWINGSVNNGEAGDFRHHWAHYDVTVMNYHFLCLPVTMG